jgi:hypothetical protein
VTLINNDGMAFIGPGSEWFWTAVSGLILAVTFIAIYRQLRAQASTRAFELLEAYVREGESESFHRAPNWITASRFLGVPSAIWIDSLDLGPPQGLSNLTLARILSACAVSASNVVPSSESTTMAVVSFGPSSR